MRTINHQIEHLSFATANVIQSIARHRKNVFFNKLWIWPTKTPSLGKPAENSGSIWIGVHGDGPDLTPDELLPTDAPYKIELPLGEQMRLEDVLVQADSANDGILIRYDMPELPASTRPPTPAVPVSVTDAS